MIARCRGNSGGHEGVGFATARGRGGASVGAVTPMDVVGRRALVRDAPARLDRSLAAGDGVAPGQRRAQSVRRSGRLAVDGVAAGTGDDEPAGWLFGGPAPPAPAAGNRVRDLEPGHGCHRPGPVVRPDPGSHAPSVGIGSAIFEIVAVTIIMDLFPRTIRANARGFLSGGPDGGGAGLQRGARLRAGDDMADGLSGCRCPGVVAGSGWRWWCPIPSGG